MGPKLGLAIGKKIEVRYSLKSYFMTLFSDLRWEIPFGKTCHNFTILPPTSSGFYCLKQASTDLIANESRLSIKRNWTMNGLSISNSQLSYKHHSPPCHPYYIKVNQIKDWYKSLISSLNRPLFLLIKPYATSLTHDSHM